MFAETRARAVVRLAVEPDVVEHDVVGGGEEVDRLAEREIGVAVGERQLRAGREVVHDLEQRRAFSASALERASRRRGRKPFEIAVRAETIGR